ncbi:MAG: serine/threonine protein kinase [Myxococcales bacterium]|nr:serine/threonine protein kinase [Myxococcales bacterium]
MTRADDYQRLMADFDALSEAPPEARAARLEVLRAEAPDTARMLERLLAADARTATPLEGGLPSLGAVAAPAEVVDDRPLPAQLGEVVGAYRLESVLGRGGMGCVYVGVHEVLGRRAAVKLLYPDLCGSDEYVSRFSFEAKIVNEVHDPNVVDIFDFVVEASPRRVACVMELIEGPTLSVVLAERRLTVTQAANICLRICRALAAVHARGVIHRDLKPDNVALTAPLDSDFAHEGAIKVLDFGIAKLESRHVEHRTRSGAILGTPAYMAPEQFSGARTDARTDQFGFN